MLSAWEYRSRRSETILNNPDAILDEYEEIVAYFQRQPSKYVNKIKELAKLENTMHSECRIVRTVPAYNEGSRIKHTLKQFVQQSINPHNFEIIVSVYPTENDITVEEIAEFKIENPQIMLTCVELSEEHGPPTVGLNRKYAADVALARILERGPTNKDTILVFNDADTIHNEYDYLDKILTKFDENITLDALTTAISIPQEALKKPNVAAAFMLTDTFEKIFSIGDVGQNHKEIPEPALINAVSAAARASIFAAVSGFNSHATIGENWELGWLIADARGWEPKRIIYYDDTVLITDPRRMLDAVANRIPMDQNLLNFQSNLDLRKLNNEAILSFISNDLDLELFQDDVDSLWRSQITGSNIRIGRRRFELIFNATMNKLGVEYRATENGGIELVNITGLINLLTEQIGYPIKVFHSQPRVYTSEMIERNRNLFARFPEESIKVRRMKAEQIAEKIELTCLYGNLEELPDLLTDYERFAGISYGKPN